METKTLFKSWWGWAPQVIEAWLEEQAAKGWHMVGATFMAMRFRFRQDAPAKVRYCADYQSEDTKNYRQLYQDAGWELVYFGSGGWYIWRKEYTDVRPEIYTDVDSMIDRNKRLLLTIFFSIMGLVMVGVFMSTGSSPDSIKYTMLAIGSLILLFDVYVIFNALTANNRLKKGME